MLGLCWAVAGCASADVTGSQTSDLGVDVAGGSSTDTTMSADAHEDTSNVHDSGKMAFDAAATDTVFPGDGDAPGGDTTESGPSGGVDVPFSCRDDECEIAGHCY
ncbi:MAG: hypothetical protein QF464_16875, partial [Myxococcota bacterium]|nr:hypothetical protein [Myxococcota bacterium]